MQRFVLSLYTGYFKYSAVSLFLFNFSLFLISPVVFFLQAPSHAFWFESGVFKLKPSLFTRGVSAPRQFESPSTPTTTENTFVT